MDWPIKITGDFTPLVQSASKIVDRIGDAVFCGRERKEVWKKALQEAQTEQDRQKILSGKWQFTGEKLVPCLDIADSSPVNAFLAIGQEQEVRNLAGNMRMALEAAQNVSDEEVAEGCIDPDWFARWRREAMVIGHEEMQRLWGRILVDEAKNPESVSYRTLDVLKNLTKHEAELFIKIGRWAIEGLLPYREEPFNKFSYKDYILLSDAGLVTDRSISSTCGLQLVNWHCARGHKKDFWIEAIPLDDQKDFHFIQGFILSEAGNQILDVADITPLSDEEIIFLCQNIEKMPRYLNGIKMIRGCKRIEGDSNGTVKEVYRNCLTPGTISGMS